MRVNRLEEMIIVGLGLMGTSLVKALKEIGPLRAAGLDIRRGPIERALADGVLAEGAVLGEEEKKSRTLLARSRFVVLSMYPDGILEFLKSYREALRPGTLVMDICGLKGAFIEKAQSLMPQGVEYVGTHPMAGKEKSGYEYADGELFLGSNFIITPTSGNTPGALQLVREVAEAIGCGRIREISPQEHDRMIAYTSHLPHILASTLIRSWQGTEDIISYAGGSFRDSTRVAEMNTQLWTQLFCYNRRELLPELQQYQKQLEMFIRTLEDGNTEAMEAFLSEASERKIMWGNMQKGDRYDGGHRHHSTR